MHKAARLISILAHPVFIPVIAILAITHIHFIVVAKLIPETKWIFILAYVMSLSAVPLLGTALMLKKYTLKDLSELSPGERSRATLVLALVYFFISFSFKTLFVDQILQIFVWAMGVSSLVLSGISRYYKISFHTFGWAGMLVLMTVLRKDAVFNINFLILLVFVICALVASARLVLKAHQHNEVYAGFFIGLICNAAVYWIAYGI